MATIKSGNSTAQLQVDSNSGAARVTEYLPDGSLGNVAGKVTFSAGINSTPGASPSDIFLIRGSDTRIIEVTRIMISTTQTTSGINSWYLAKRSTANSGGTSTSVVPVPHDRNDVSPTATILQYTANPTLGNLVGYLWKGHVPSPCVASFTLDFSKEFGKPITLRGAGDVLAMNFGGATLPSGLVVLGSITWTEE